MVTEIVILALLRLGPKHGYEISNDIKAIFRRRTPLNTNLLYPALHRLEAQKAVEKEVREQQGKPTKHLYRITPAGIALFQELIGQFGEVEAAKDDEFLVRLAFFDFIDEPTRLRILDMRKRDLTQGLKQHEKLRSAYAHLYASSWVRQISDFSEKHIAAEIEWVEALEKAARDDVVTGPSRKTRRTTTGMEAGR